MHAVREKVFHLHRSHLRDVNAEPLRLVLLFMQIDIIVFPHESDWLFVVQRDEKLPPLFVTFDFYPRLRAQSLSARWISALRGCVYDAHDLIAAGFLAESPVQMCSDGR